MAGRRCSWNVGPDGLEPSEVLVSGYAAGELHGGRRAAISARLPEHEDSLAVVLDYPIRQIGLSEEDGGARSLERYVRDFKPGNWREIVEAKAAGANLNVGGEGQDVVPARSAARNANVAHNAA